MIAMRKFLSVLVLIATTNCVIASNNMADLSAEPCGKFGKLFSAAVGIGAGLVNSFEQDTLVHTRIQTDSGYQTKPKPIKDIQVGDEVLAWDELQAHDNAQLANSGTSGQAAQTLQAAYQQASLDAKLGDKSASSPINTGASSYENKSNFSSLSSVKPAQRYEKVTDIASSFKEQTLLHISLDNGQTIQATAGHPFKTREGWRDAVLLKKGGQLLLGGEAADADQPTERFATILEIREEVKTTAVFNLEVANLHTFFVGVDGVVVHNARSGTSGNSSAAAAGQTAHKNPALGPPGTRMNVQLPNSLKRADFVDFNSRTIWEMKPCNSRATKKGVSQVDDYVKLANSAPTGPFAGGGWRGMVFGGY